MARPRKNPDYDAEKIMNELLDTVVEIYQKTADIADDQGEIKSTADELQLAPHKVRKLLVTAGMRDRKKYYSSPSAAKVQLLHKEGKTINEIMAATGLNRTSVCCYLPYSKGLYNAKELSLDAERIRRYRDRQKRCAEFMDEISIMDETGSEEHLWELINYLQGCVFRTSGRGSKEGVRFTYKVKGGEVFVNRKMKSITRATVMLAFHKAREVQSECGCVSGPKALGTFGASYLYPVFLRLGVCTQAVRPESEE